MMTMPGSPHTRIPGTDALLFGAVAIAHIAGILAIARISQTVPPLQAPKILQAAWVGDAIAPPPSPQIKQHAQPRSAPAGPTPVPRSHPARPATLATTSPDDTGQPPTEPAAPQAPASIDTTTPATQAAATDATPATAPEHPAEKDAPHFRPDYHSNPKPEYPYLSRQLHEQGRVLLSVLIDSDGRARTVALRQSSGFERLDSAAIEAVRRWRFLPARQGDAPVPESVIIPIDFKFSRSTT